MPEGEKGQDSSGNDMMNRIKLTDNSSVEKQADVYKVFTNGKRIDPRAFSHREHRDHREKTTS